MGHNVSARLTKGTSVRVENLTFSYGAKTILDSARFTLDSTRTSYLVRENVVEKTALLKILAYQLEPHSGEIVASRPDYTVAYVPPPTRTFIWPSSGAVGRHPDREGFRRGSRHAQPIDKGNRLYRRHAPFKKAKE
jgi:ABC-type phosphonate transport system ATPase subunit